MKSGSVKLVLLVKMTNVFYVCFRIITTKEKNTTERHFNEKPTTKKNKTHPSQSIIFSLMLHAKRGSNIYQFDSLWFDPIGTRGGHANHYTIDAAILWIC
jgi:hypothetical protein